MIFYDATVWGDRESLNVPSSWGMTAVKMLYTKDFYNSGDDQDLPPTDAKIKELAKATRNDVYVCINIGEGTGWRLYIPGSWGYDNQTLPGAQHNAAQRQKAIDTLAEFRKWNTTSKLGWWGKGPAQSSVQQINNIPVAQDNRYKWTGPKVPGAPYSGLIEMEQWYMAGIDSYIDMVCCDAYVKTNVIDQPDLSYWDFWKEQIQFYKLIADTAPTKKQVMAFIMPRYEESNTHILPEGTMYEMISRLNEILQFGDGVALWEGNQAPAMNQIRAELNGVSVDTRAQWLITWSEWINRS